MQTAMGTRHKVLIFHIGDHKTGSTSIQLAFAKGLVSLEGHSVFYPATLASNGLGEHIKTYYSGKSGVTRQNAGAAIRHLADRVRACEADFTLISAEIFETIPAQHLHEIINTFFDGAADEIRIFGYVRPHAARITSSFAERIKVGAKVALDSTLEKFAYRPRIIGEFNYVQRFTAWRGCFAETFTLRPMIRSQMLNGSVVEDFVHHAFGGIPYHISGNSEANESLCLEDLMRIKMVQKNLSVQPDLRLKVGWEVARLIGHLPPAPIRTKLELHKDLAVNIRKTYLKDARDMDKAFFDGNPLLERELDRAVDTAIAEPLSTEPADYLDANELRSLNLMAAMVGGMLEAKDINWSAFLHQKRVMDVKKARKILLSKLEL